MISKEHYFDWAATAPQDESIIKEALQCSLEHWGNPSSIHEAGSDAKKFLEEARKRAGKALNVNPENIYFTSGGTESDHIPLLSVLTRPQKGNIILSAIEHPALREMAKMVENCGWKTIFVSPNKDGVVEPEAIEEKLNGDTAFVSVMAVNNETGVIQPIYKIADMLTDWAKNKRRPLFHVDCVQAGGKIPLNLNYRGIDAASFSAHKIGGPRGSGILYLSKEINSFLRGGGQEKGIRSGTENLFGATAISLCLEKYFISEQNQTAFERYKTQENWTNDFINGLKKIKGCSIIPHKRGSSDAQCEAYSPWIVQASFPGIPGQVMERALSSKGFYISTGSACSAGKHSRPILDTMQIAGEEKEAAVRFSFGFSTSQKSMQELLEAIKEVTEQFL